MSLNFLVLITYSISFRFCQSKGWKLFLSLLLLFWLYMANCRHKHFTPLINLNYTLFCFGIHHKNPLYKSHLRKSQLYFQDTSFFSCKLLYQYQHWRLHMQKNVYICLTTLACKKNVYTLAKNILYTKLIYCDHYNKNIEHSNLRITKIWVKKKRVMLHL